MRFIQNLYWNQYGTMKLREDESNKLRTKRSVRQGCILSPFDLCMEEILRKADKLPGVTGADFVTIESQVCLHMT